MDDLQDMSDSDLKSLEDKCWHSDGTFGRNTSLIIIKLEQIRREIKSIKGS